MVVVSELLVVSIGLIVKYWWLFRLLGSCLV